MVIHELAHHARGGRSMADAVEAQERGARHPKLSSPRRRWPMVCARAILSVKPESAGPDLPRYVLSTGGGRRITETPAGALRDPATQMEYERRTRAELQGRSIYPTILVLSGCSLPWRPCSSAVPGNSPISERDRPAPAVLPGQC